MGRKLILYMIDGTATGPATIEIGNWSGKAIFCPRASLKALLRRAEFASPGVYLLQNQSGDDHYDSSIYIGEAEVLAKRLKHHLADRDFESVVCFSSRELTKAHIKYLEAKLIQLAKDANTSYVENGNRPRAAHLPESDISDMEDFIEQIKLILPVVGIRALVPAVSRRHEPLRNMSGRQQYRIKSKGLSATMVELKDGFLVRAGSEASAKVTESLNLSWRNIRTKLLDAHVLKEEGDKLIFAEDAIFASPSAASSVVLGRQSPGPIVWILDDGRTYKEVQAEQTGE